MSSTSVAFRSFWVVALAFVALASISRTKPATPKRPAVVRVNQSTTPLYRTPSPEKTRRTIGTLAGGSVVVGAILASLIGLGLAIVLSVIGSALRG